MKFLKDNLPLLAVSLGHFVNDFFMSVVPVTLFAFSEKMSLSAFQMSLILFVITTGGTFFQPIVGTVIDRVHKSSLLIYALILISVGMSTSGLISNFYLLAIVVAIAALGSSVYHPLGSTITIHKTSLTRGKSLSVFMTIGSFAHTAAPLIAIPLVSLYGVESLSVLLIPGLLTALLLFIAKVQDVKWLDEKKEKKEKSPLTSSQKRHLSIPLMIGVTKNVLYRIILVFGVLILMAKGMEEIHTAFYISAFMFSRSIATLIGGFVSDSIGEKKTLTLFNSTALLAVLLIAYTTGPLMIIGLVGLGFSINATSAANITLTHRIVPENVNYGTGLIMGFSATISAILMVAYGLLVDMMGQLTAFNVAVFFALVSVILSIVIPSVYDETVSEIEQRA